MTRTVTTRALTQSDFAPFGDVLEVSGTPDKIINQGMCGRFHDVANLDFGTGRAGISIFDAKARNLPYTLDMMERHPAGSQAFVPMHRSPYLVIVAADKGGAPDTPVAFLALPGQGVNYHRNVWHGVLTPLHLPGQFAVIDRIGDGANLEEHWFDQPWTIAQNPQSQPT
ncbi:MAG: ureidoglycolate lyase [Sulfitobacter sp.]